MEIKLTLPELLMLKRALASDATERESAIGEAGQLKVRLTLTPINGPIMSASAMRILAAKIDAALEGVGDSD